ncbi:hypothetical protein OH492_00350 [Vibrio chagasii]|nr:hypothetical protein [Vibrio chagasii]
MITPLRSHSVLRLLKCKGFRGMKRYSWCFGIVLAIAVAIIAALLLSLRTQYRADVANFFIKHTVDQPVVVKMSVSSALSHHPNGNHLYQPEKATTSVYPR